MRIVIGPVDLGEDLARDTARGNADPRGALRTRRACGSDQTLRSGNDPKIENRRRGGPDIVDRRGRPVRQRRNRPDRNRRGIARGTLRTGEARIDDDSRRGRGRRG